MKKAKRKQLPAIDMDDEHRLYYKKWLDEFSEWWQKMKEEEEGETQETFHWKLSMFNQHELHEQLRNVLAETFKHTKPTDETDTKTFSVLALLLAEFYMVRFIGVECDKDMAKERDLADTLATAANKWQQRNFPLETNHDRT